MEVGGCELGNGVQLQIYQSWAMFSPCTFILNWEMAFFWDVSLIRKCFETLVPSPMVANEKRY